MPDLAHKEPWVKVKLGDIGQSLIGLTYSPESVRDVGTLVLRSSNIQDGQLVFDDNVFVNCDIQERIRIQENDILICVRNGSRSLIGKSVMLGEQVVGETFGAFMAVYRSEFNPYLRYFFQSSDCKRQIDEHLGSTINQITNASLNSFQVLLPGKAEREAIIPLLDDVDHLITSLDALIAKKRDIKQGAMQQLLTGKTRLPGFSGEWSNVKLGDLLTYEQPGPYIVESAEYSKVGRIRVLTAGKSFVLGYTNEIHGVFSSGPVIIFDDFTTASKYVDFAFKVKSSAMKMLHAVPALSDLRFMYERLQLIRHIPGDHKRYWISEYREIEIEVPQWNEQTAIAEVLADMDAEIDALVARREKTALIKSGMMQELLTGRTRLL